MKIDEMEVKELKIMAYDIMVSIQKLQNDLVAVNSIIGQKSNMIIDKEPKEEDKKG